MKLPVFENHLNRPAYDVLGDRYTLLLSAEETAGAYSMFEFCVPEGHGSPPHLHTNEDESFFILSGEVLFTIDGKEILAKAGDVVFGPRGIAHNFKAVSQAAVRMICVVSPGGFENFFAAAGTIVSDRSVAAAAPSEADIARMLQVAPQFGIKILTPG